MNTERIIRKLARSDYYQFLYSKAKDLHNLKIINNIKDLTGIQIMLLRWLEAYNIMSQDILLNEKYINEEVIEDDIRSEAYLVYRHWKNQEEHKKLDNKDDNKVKDVFNRSEAPSIIFTEE